MESLPVDVLSLILSNLSRKEGRGALLANKRFLAATKRPSFNWRLPFTAYIMEAEAVVMTSSCATEQDLLSDFLHVSVLYDEYDTLNTLLNRVNQQFVKLYARGLTLADVKSCFREAALQIRPVRDNAHIFEKVARANRRRENDNDDAQYALNNSSSSSSSSEEEHEQNDRNQLFDVTMGSWCQFQVPQDDDYDDDDDGLIPRSRHENYLAKVVKEERLLMRILCDGYNSRFWRLFQAKLGQRMVHPNQPPVPEGKVRWPFFYDPTEVKSLRTFCKAWFTFHPSTLVCDILNGRNRQVLYSCLVSLGQKQDLWS